jgi:hypothetical protein
MVYLILAIMVAIWLGIGAACIGSLYCTTEEELGV